MKITVRMFRGELLVNSDDFFSGGELVEFEFSEGISEKVKTFAKSKIDDILILQREDNQITRKFDEAIKNTDRESMRDANKRGIEIQREISQILQEIRG